MATAEPHVATQLVIMTRRDRGTWSAGQTAISPCSPRRSEMIGPRMNSQLKLQLLRSAVSGLVSGAARAAITWCLEYFFNGQ